MVTLRKASLYWLHDNRRPIPVPDFTARPRKFCDNNWLNNYDFFRMKAYIVTAIVIHWVYAYCCIVIIITVLSDKRLYIYDEQQQYRCLKVIARWILGGQWSSQYLLSIYWMMKVLSDQSLLLGGGRRAKRQWFLPFQFVPRKNLGDK